MSPQRHLITAISLLTKIVSICVITAVTSTTATAEQQDHNGSLSFNVDDYYRRALDPFWRTKEMHETCLFTQRGSREQPPTSRNGWPSCNFLFRPATVFQVQSPSHDILYQEGAII